MNLQILPLVCSVPSCITSVLTEWRIISQRTFLHSCWRMRAFISYHVTDCKILSRAALIWYLQSRALSLNADCRVNETPNLNINWIETEDLTTMYLANILMFGIFTHFLVSESLCHFREKWHHLYQIRNQVFIFYFFQKSFVRITPAWHVATPGCFIFLSPLFLYIGLFTKRHYHLTTQCLSLPSEKTVLVHKLLWQAFLEHSV